MICFQDMVGKKDTPEPRSPAEYQDIKPYEHLSKEDALKFWDDKFAAIPEASDIQSTDEEILLTEIFGRYEDEFQFDFELDDEIKSVLDCLDFAKWEKLSGRERLEKIDELAATIGKRLGLDENPIIQFYDGRDGSYGAYLPEENTMVINCNTLSDAKEIVDTVAHEMRHAYQHQRAELQETWQDTLYKLNFENYISPISLADGKYLFFNDYQDQLVEAEARAFANIFTNKEAA